ncbi:uncharacterized protein EV420DRAFT_1616195 [Desarmillaria tabescens]|uniref:Phytanoyl-CoA dioxygenase n=1 Tax=Armillaria tabescens TaxID=1929756 RepID=A0AA39NPU2_ARMTA|nr:uncharacterized protein EV420DRAFT_1616195 [Desarmillaria tabescens]KAK0469644.1 hypothetical protein EV420DRAFT_1616195 [Desarmillaria tabescens]
MTVPITRKGNAPVFPPFKYANLLDEANFGDWRDELAIHGYVVVKGAVTPEKALEYRDRAFSWLESFGLGFDRNDESTWKNEHLPVHIKGGMFHGYGIEHEQFVWDLRTKQGIIDAFAKLWGTNELVTSFDAGAVMLPHRTDVTDGGKWEHMDQSPSRVGFYCCQSVINLNECGPEDGGLMVLRNSSRIVGKYFDEIGRDETRTWGPVDWYGFTDAQQEWFYERGCEWVKVEAGPGDLIMWDSRTIHYNVRPSGDRSRVCTYICMAPAELLSEEDKETRSNAFKLCRGTTHVPFASIYSREHQPKLRKGKPCPLDTGIPKEPRRETERVLKLAGILAY